MEETIRKVSAIFDKMASVKITPTSNYSVPEYWMNRAIKGDEKCKDTLFNWISSILNIDKSILNAVFNAKYNKVNENKIMNKKLIRLTENDLHKIVEESAKRIMKEVALKGKSGKTYSLHGTDPESWAVMSRVRGKNGYFPNTPQHYHACRDEDNWIELDDKAHPNLRSRNNANRINAMMNRIDDKSKDIMAANESKLSRVVKESVKRILREKNYIDLPDGYDKEWQDMANSSIYNGSYNGYGEAGDRLRHLNGYEPNKKQQMDSDWRDKDFDEFQTVRYNNPLDKRNNNVDNFDSHYGLYYHPAISEFDDANRERGVNPPPRRRTPSYGIPYADMLRMGYDFDHSTM
jgi:hypothetical protein